MPRALKYHTARSARRSDPLVSKPDYGSARTRSTTVKSLALEVAETHMEPTHPAETQRHSRPLLLSKDDLQVQHGDMSVDGSQVQPRVHVRPLDLDRCGRDDDDDEELRWIPMWEYSDGEVDWTFFLRDRQI